MSSVRSSWKYEPIDASGGIVHGDEEEKSLSDSGTKATYQKSNSSSSSTSSEDEFFQLDPSVFGKPFAGVPTTQNSSPLENKKLLHGDATESTPQGGNTGDYTSSLQDETADPDGSNLPGPNHAPSQEAGTRGEYDPNSVPACVFERIKLVAPADWSVASKDTLLSNHVRSNSLSCSPPEAGASVPLMFDSDMTNWDVANDLERSSSNEATATNDETVENVLRAATEEHGDMNMPPAEGTHSDGTSRCSDASSSQSFVFPILTGGSGPLRVVPEQLPWWQKHPQTEEPNAPRRTPRSPQNKWLLCFSCSFCHAGDDH